MAGSRARMEGVRELWLPPEDVRRWDVETQGLIETPLDAHGMADLDELVTIGKETVAPGYDWTSRFNDVHHLQWPRSRYQTAEDNTAFEFRELARRKAYIPRRFHNWLHSITMPPPVPDEEVMRHCIAGERTAKALAEAAGLATRLTRMKCIPEEKLQIELERNYEKYVTYVENAREVPLEFRLLQPEEVEARSVEEMLEMNSLLGELALGHVPRRNRKICNAAA